ncbi:MauE/DoxX family redox-associated membrane protein [Bacteroidota bacterium]
MNNFLSNKYLLFLFRVIIGFIFIYAGTLKISDPAGFSDAINNYDLLPLSFVNYFAITLPWIEVVAGLFLLFGISVKENSLIISVMLVVFILAIIISLGRGLNIECGCFGTTSGTKVGIIKLVENIILLCLTLLLTKFNSVFLSIISHKNNS